MFGVITLDLNNIPKRDGRVDFSEDFFGKEAKLTVSGQLSGEMFALGLGVDLHLRSPRTTRTSTQTKASGRVWQVGCAPTSLPRSVRLASKADYPRRS
jgi:asparaginyl-tRNA synthetase